MPWELYATKNIWNKNETIYYQVCSHHCNIPVANSSVVLVSCGSSRREERRNVVKNQRTSWK